MAAAKSADRRLVFFGAVGTKLFVVARLFWTAVAAVGTGRDCGVVGDDRADDAEILSAVALGVLSVGAVAIVGELCDGVERGGVDGELGFF